MEHTGQVDAAEQTYHVHATWSASEPVEDATLTAVGAALQPDDETFCFWVDEKDPRTVVASWDLLARSVEHAAHLCRAALLPLDHEPEFKTLLTEIGVSTDEGFWVTTDPEHDVPV